MVEQALTHTHTQKRRKMKQGGAEGDNVGNIYVSEWVAVCIVMVYSLRVYVHSNVR